MKDRVMKKNIVKNCLVLGIIALLIGTSVFPLIEDVRADGPGYEIAQGTLSICFERKLARTSDGVLHCVYCRLEGSYYRIYHAYSTNDGVTWTEETEPLSPSSQDCRQPCIAVDQYNNIHVAWCWWRAPAGPSWYGTIQYRVKTTSWQAIENNVITGYYDYPSLAVDSKGVVHLAVGGYSGGSWNCAGVQYLKKVTPSSSWSPPYPVSSSGWATAPALVIDGNDDIHVAYRHAPQYGPHYGSRYRRTIDSVWQGEEIIQEDDDLWSHCSIAIDNTGDVYAVWCHTVTGQIKLGKRSPSGTWPQPFGDVLAADGYSKVDASLSIDGSNAIHIVWCGKDANSPNYYQMRYRKYSGGWSGVSYLTSASVNQCNPNLIWAWYPVVNGNHINIPQTGYASAWNDGTSIRFYKSSDLNWDGGGQPDTIKPGRILDLKNVDRTDTGFIYPTGLKETCIYPYPYDYKVITKPSELPTSYYLFDDHHDQYAEHKWGWLARGPNYYADEEYQIAQDIPATQVGEPVYAIADGTIVAVSTGGWGGSGDNNYALFIRHVTKTGGVFWALYGHIRPDNPDLWFKYESHTHSLPEGQVNRIDVKRGELIGTIGPWVTHASFPHLHFAIHPGDTLPSSNPGYGYRLFNYWPNTDGFIDPINYIKTKSPAQTGSILNAIILSWSAPADDEYIAQSGLVTGYHVDCLEISKWWVPNPFPCLITPTKNQEQGKWTTGVVKGLFQSLKPGFTYMMNVHAYDDAGNQGDLSNTVWATMPGACVAGLCPIDLEITDPDGLIINKYNSEIPDATYNETDLDGDSDADDLIGFPIIKKGNYLITVIPEPEAGPTDTYSLEMVSDGITITLAENVQISDIPDEPYVVKSNESGIYAAPIPAFTYLPENPIVDQLIIFNSSLSMDPDGYITNWTWNFGDGGSSALQNPTHIYTDDRTYHVTLTVTDNDGLSDSITKDVIVRNPPLVANAGGPYYGYSNTDICFTGSAVGGEPPYYFSWDLDNDSEFDDAFGNVSHHSFNVPGVYTISLNVRDTDWHYSISTTQVNVNRMVNPPDIPDRPSGLANGKTGVEYTYATSTIDSEGDQVYYLWDWGDGSISVWDGPYNSGATCEAKHTWSVKNTYNIKVKAKDMYDAESPWSDSLPVTMPYTYKPPLLQFLELLFQRFPNAFPILRQMLGY